MKLKPTSPTAYKICDLRDVPQGAAYVSAWQADDVRRSLQNNDIFVRCQPTRNVEQQTSGVLVCRVSDGIVDVRAGDQKVTLVDATVVFSLIHDGTKDA